VTWCIEASGVGKLQHPAITCVLVHRSSSHSAAGRALNLLSPCGAVAFLVNDFDKFLNSLVLPRWFSPSHQLKQFGLCYLAQDIPWPHSISRGSCGNVHIGRIPRALRYTLVAGTPTGFIDLFFLLSFRCFARQGAQALGDKRFKSPGGRVAAWPCTSTHIIAG
jgi:hypothetical protein